MIHRILSLIAIMCVIAPLPAAARSACDSTIPVTVTLAGDLDATVPSASVGFHAKINNTGSNTFPDSVLLVSVMRSDRGRSDEIVDRFVAPQHVTVFGHYSGTVDFAWRTPGTLSTGTYTVITTLVPPGAPAAEVFAHTGYPTASTDIEIKDGTARSASIQTIAVNGQPYKALTVAHISDGAATATAVVHNGSLLPYIGTVTWRLYAPGSKLTDAPLDERSAPVEIHPGSDTEIAYQIPPQEGGAYYLQGELSQGGQRVMFDILLDSGETAFPWTNCPNGVFGTITSMSGGWYGVLALAIILSGAWYVIRRRRARA